MRFGKSQDGRHGAFTLGYGLLHELAAGANSADGLGKREGASGDVGAVLAERVSGGEGWGQAGHGLLHYAVRRDGDGQDSGLGMLGELQGIDGTTEDDLGERKPERFIGFLEYGFGCGKTVLKVASHPDGL